MELDTLVRSIVRDEIAAAHAAPADPVLISIDEAAKIFGCGDSVINELIKDSATNGFPSIRLSTKTVRIDKARLNKWINAGGLGVKV